MRMNSLSSSMLAIAMIGSSMMVSAEELDGGVLYSSPGKGGCTACHGKDARSPLMDAYPKLAGQNAGYLLQQMKDIKSGARNNGMTVAMKGVMHLVNDEEMAAIAKHLSELTP